MRHESSAWLFGPMLVLIVLCLGMAVFPGEAIVGLSRPISEILGPAVRQGTPNIESWARSLAVVSQINAGTLIAIGMSGFACWSFRGRPFDRKERLGACGYLQPTVRMQYTGRSFAEMIAEHLLPRFLRPHSKRRILAACSRLKAILRPIAVIRSVRRCTCRSFDAGPSGSPAPNSPARVSSRLPGLHRAHRGRGLGLGLLAKLVVCVMSELLVLLAIVATAASGAAGFAARPASMGGQRLAALLIVIGDSLGLSGVSVFWVAGDSRPIVVVVVPPRCRIQRGRGWLVGPLPGADLPDLAAGQRLWAGLLEADRAPENGRKLRLFYGTLTAGMAPGGDRPQQHPVPVRLGDHGPLGLLPGHDRGPRQEVREAGWIYLVATHVATLVPVRPLRFAARGDRLLRAWSARIRSSLTPGVATAIFVLALVGVRPQGGHHAAARLAAQRHAIAPSHVSAIMSGVIIKMGIYGLVRVTSLLPDPPLEWGVTSWALAWSPASWGSPSPSASTI